MAIEKQIWIDMILEGGIPDASFLSKSVDMSPLVENNKINLAEAGVEPEVLFDNKVYPIAVASRDDIPLEIALHTLDTKNTVVRNIEAMELAYDKMASVVRGHKNALHRYRTRLAAHNWCPQKNTATTPVLATSGSKNKAGLKAASFEDFLFLAAKYKGMDVDISRVTVALCPVHEMDLMAEDKKLYKSIIEGGKLFGMNLFSSSALPYFNATSGEKLAYGAAAGATDTQASIIYCEDNVMCAAGDTDVFVTYKSPTERGDILGYQQRFTALPINGKNLAAIYSAKSL